MGPINFDFRPLLIAILVAGMVLGVVLWKIVAWLIAHVSVRFA